LILEEAEKLYNKLTTKLTNDIIVAAAAAMKTISSLPLPSSNNNIQKLTHKNTMYQRNPNIINYQLITMTETSYE
jgi:hypothetical protein